MIKLYFLLFLIFNNLFAEDNLFKQKILLTNQYNKIVKLEDFKGDLLALTMGYTECKKTCPSLTIKTLREMELFFKSKNQKINIVTITLDPDHDTPEVLNNYKNKLKVDDKWHFLTTSKLDTRLIATSLKLDDYWTMDDHIIHGFKILLFDQQLNYKGILDWDNRDVALVMKQ